MSATWPKCFHCSTREPRARFAVLSNSALGNGVGNACPISPACLSEERPWGGWGGEGPGVLDVADTDLVQHCPGTGSYCKADPALAKGFPPGAGGGAGGAVRGWLGRLSWRRRGMCGTTASSAAAKGGRSGSRAVALPKALNQLKYSPARKGSKRAVRSERETTSPLYRIIHRPPFSTEVIFLLSPVSSG